MAKTRVVIVGYGGIGKIIAKIARMASVDILIYKGRSKNNFVEDLPNEQHFSGNLADFISQLATSKNQNSLIFWCCGPDTLGSNTLSRFFHHTIEQPLNLATEASGTACADFQFVHFSTVSGFELPVVPANITSAKKSTSIDKPYEHAKKVLDCSLEKLASRHNIANFRLSNLITSDHLSSNRKTIIRLARSLALGQDVLVHSQNKLDFVIESQIEEVVAKIIHQQQRFIGSYNFSNGIQFALGEIFQAIIKKIHSKNSQLGRLTLCEQTATMVPTFTPAFLFNSEVSIDIISDEILKHATLHS